MKREIREKEKFQKQKKLIQPYYHVKEGETTRGNETNLIYILWSNGPIIAVYIYNAKFCPVLLIRQQLTVSVYL